MEFRAQDVAQLVLGYLKETKCKKAFREYLNTCVYLREHAASYRKGQYFITRVSGLSLIEYLNEYAHIYTIVQERLEASAYYKENQSRTSLAKQLLYLLDKIQMDSRASTPIIDEPSTNSHFFQEGNNSNNDENVPDHTSFDGIMNGISSTPNTLNSTVREISYIKKSKVTPTADKSTSTDTETDFREKSHEECEEIFTHTFLDNVELIEKLADNINKEVSKSTTDLDNTAIKSIVQRTEADPIFVQLLNELIDSPDHADEKLPDPTREVQKSVASEKSVDDSITKKATKSTNDSSIKRRLRNSKQTKEASIEEQNKDAVESICMHAASLSSEKQPLVSVASKNSSVISTELVLSTEQHIPQSLYTTPTTQNTVFTSTANLLMLQPSTSLPPTNILPQKTLSLDGSKSCYLIGNQPFVNVSVPPTPLKIPGVLSEQDILSMPTIFVCDTGQQLANTQAVVVPTTSSVLGTPRYQNIAPKQTTEKIQSLSEFITLYKCNDIASPVKTTTTQSKQPPSINITEIAQVTVDSEIKISKCVEEKTANASNKNPTQPEAAKVSAAEIEIKTNTPEVKIPEKKEKASRNTPKGTSHVRQLDFSTPEKIISSPSVESSTKTKKVANSKNVRATLFKPADEEGNAKESTTNDDTKIASGSESESTLLRPSWDANLRGFQISQSPIKTAKENHKRKRSEDPTKQKPVSKNPKLCENVTTDEVSSNKPPAKEQNDSKDHAATTKVKERRTHKKTPKKKPSSQKKAKKKPVETTEVNDSICSDISSAVEEKTESLEHDENIVEKPLHVINRNMVPKLRRKCNMDNSKKTSATEEVILTSVPKIKSLEVLDEHKSTLILSPSKLNASKRSLVELENQTDTENIVINLSTDSEGNTNDEKKKDSAVEEFLDPASKPKSVPLLQTPIKIDVIPVPKTPGVNTSVTIDTPFTRAVIDQLNGVDITSIPTPKFPITPNFALTPAFAHSPFSNRGTDYSTSSSYYQPSDNEQNKSLEQLIQECQRLEKQTTLSTSTEDVGGKCEINVQVDEIECSTASLETVVHVAPNKNDKELEENTESGLSKSEESIQKMIAEKQKAFNESLPGKKNMQLAKILSGTPINNSDSESVSSQDDSSSSEDDTSDTDSTCADMADNDNKLSPYSLRPRKTPTLSDDKLPVKTSSEVTVKCEKPLAPHKADVLQKMETIRQRTIAKFKDTNPTSKPKSATLSRSLNKLRKETSKLPNHKFAKCKSIPSGSSSLTQQKTNEGKHTKNSKKAQDSSRSIVKVNDKVSESANIKQKSKITTKKVPNKNITLSVAPLKGTSENKIGEERGDTVKTSDYTATVEKENTVLHLSSDEENLEPFEMVETELLECSTSSTPLCEETNDRVNVANKKQEIILDNEAESLVMGLKKWGIHLIPNKSVKNNNAADAKETKLTSHDENKTKEPTNVEEKTDLRNNDVVGEINEEDKKECPLKNKSESVEKETKSSLANIKKNSTVKNDRKDNSKKHSESKKSQSDHKKSQTEAKKSQSEQIAKVNVPELPKDIVNSKVAKDSVKVTEELPAENTIKPAHKETNFEVQFDTRTYEEETVKIKHDDKIPPGRKMSDYNFEILTKTFSANVFIEEINTEVEKLLSFSRFKFILDIASKSSNKKADKPKTTNESSQSKKKKPLNLLYNQLIQEPVTMERSSPLENLYASDKITRDKSALVRSGSISINKSDKLDRSGRSKRSLSHEKCDAVRNTKSKSSEEVTHSFLKDNNRNALFGKDTEFVDQDGITDSENDLMNYALIGSERIENSEDVFTLPNTSDKRKRKASTDEGNNQEEKKKKTKQCQELLRNIDVDSFLKHLHGDT